MTRPCPRSPTRLPRTPQMSETNSVFIFRLRLPPVMPLLLVPIFLLLPFFLFRLLLVLV